MQTPKARANSSGAHQRKSPRSVSSEALHKTSPRAASSEASQKDSPRVVRTLKTSPRYLNPTASSTNQAAKTPKESSPKVSDCRSSKSPLSEKKHPDQVAELESQISQLECDLKVVKDQLCSSEASKKEALEDAKESNRQLSILSEKVEHIQKQISERSASQKVNVLEHGKTTDEQDQTLQSKLEALWEQHSCDSDALASALDEIGWLKAQLESVTDTKATQGKHSESAQTELCKLKENLVETFSVVEEMKQQLKECKESEDQAKELVHETLMQLEMAKTAVETLRADGNKVSEAYSALSCELEKSRAHVNFLEELVSNLKAEIGCIGCKDLEKKDDCQNAESVGTELDVLRCEVEQLRSAVKGAEAKCNEERVRSEGEIRNAVEMTEWIKSASGQREAELEAELRKSKYEIEELKTSLMDKETELQGICEENDDLMMRLENASTEHEQEKELQKLKSEIESMEAGLMDKETEWQNVSEENRLLKLEIEEMSKTNNEAASGLEVARAAEREALMKVGYMTEEVDKSNRKLARVTEQLEAEQAAYAELEGELRKLKVQSDQWRKAAEAATAMLSAGNNGHLIERTGSMDSSYCPRTRRISSPYTDDLDEELFKKRNGNVLSRFGVLWKKPQK